METMQNNGLLALLVVAACLFVALMIPAIVSAINEFIGELNHLNQEIKCTTGEEQEYWKREKRRLLWSLLPFFGR